MSDFSTISVPRDIKRLLEEAKGDKEWGPYLLELYNEAEKDRRRESFNKLTRLLDEDLDSIEGSGREFREKLRI